MNTIKTNAQAGGEQGFAVGSRGSVSTLIVEGNEQLLQPGGEEEGLDDFPNLLADELEIEDSEMLDDLGGESALEVLFPGEDPDEGVTWTLDD